MENQVSLRDVIQFFLNQNQESLANQFVLGLKEEQRVVAVTMINEHIVAREQKHKADKLRTKQEAQAKLDEFKETIKGWATALLINWYGDHGPSSSPFSRLGGEMDEYVEAVCLELFGEYGNPGRIPQDQHKQVQQHIQGMINERFNPKPTYSI